MVPPPPFDPLHPIQSMRKKRMHQEALNAAYAHAYEQDKKRRENSEAAKTATEQVRATAEVIETADDIAHAVARQLTQNDVATQCRAIRAGSGATQYADAMISNAAAGTKDPELMDEYRRFIRGRHRDALASITLDVTLGVSSANGGGLSA